VTSLQVIRDKVRLRQYEFSKHAVDQSILRDIRATEIEEAVMGRSELIGDYPDDKRGPSCLILGFTKSGRPLHIHVSYADRPMLRVITLYEPDPDHWVDLRKRKDKC
jgi:hypothetical protein